MTALPGTWVARDAGGNGTTTRASRLAQAGLLAKNSDGTVRVGVLADGQGAVVTGDVGMTYNIRKHVAVTKMSETNGPTLVPNDGPVSVATDPAPGSNSRIDVIYVLQNHLTGDGGVGASNAAVFGVAKGSTSATPPVPSIPTGATELARTTVTAGTTATSGLTIIQGAKTWAGPAEVDTVSGFSWGVAFDPAIHRRKTHVGHKIVVPIAGGYGELLPNLASEFVGVVGGWCHGSDDAIDVGAVVTYTGGTPAAFSGRFFTRAGVPIVAGIRVTYGIEGWVLA